MPNVGGKKFPYTQQGKKQAKRYAKKTGQSIENRGGSRMMRNPGMAPRSRRGAGPGARKMRPPVGPGTRPSGPRPIGPPPAPHPKQQWQVPPGWGNPGGGSNRPMRHWNNAIQANPVSPNTPNYDDHSYGPGSIGGQGGGSNRPIVGRRPNRRLGRRRRNY